MSVANPRFPRHGHQPQRLGYQPIILAIFPQELHEIERLDPGPSLDVDKCAVEHDWLTSCQADVTSSGNLRKRRRETIHLTWPNKQEMA